MENERFDQLTKQLASGTDRRGVLKRFAGGAAAVVAGLMAADASAKGRKKRGAKKRGAKKKGAKSSGGGSLSGNTYPCTNPGTCDSKYPCCTGYKCCGGKCVEGTTCPPPPCTNPGTCDSKYPCCTGYKCCDGKCVEGTTCPPPSKFCGHSVGPNGGCKGACTSAGFTGRECNPICGNGQFTGYCPVGQGGDNPCCNTGLCTPGNFKRVNGVVTYVGPTAGC